MDDLVKSVGTPQQAIKCYRRLVETLKRSEFILMKWASNCPEVTGNIPQENSLEANEVMLNAEPTSSSILGLEWKKDQDCLQVCRGPNKDCLSAKTQRVVSPFVFSVFDPMGIFAPFTMRMRMLLKSICIHHGQSWDERLNEEEKQIFMDWINEMQMIWETSLPRRFFCYSTECRVAYILRCIIGGNVYCCLFLSRNWCWQRNLVCVRQM